MCVCVCVCVFLKFHYGNKLDSKLLLRNVLRDPEVYSKHPQPEVAAAIMVVDRFSPQIQAYLCNFAAAARELDLDKALHDNLSNCCCRSTMWKLLPDDLNPEGHLLTIDSRNLKWPQLKSIVTKGKKFRLEADSDSVLVDLRRTLDDYCVWYCRKYGDSSVKLSTWASEVYARCRINWQRALHGGSNVAEQKPEGYPGLREAIHEAQRNLVFLHDDRAPHGLLMVCKRWYQREMARYLMDSSVFESCANFSWKDIVGMAQNFNVAKSFTTSSGIVYNYGIWKPTKGKFRFIAGTRAPSRDECVGVEVERMLGPPRQPLFDAHKALVKILQHVELVLLEKDQLRQRQEGIRAFWGIDSVFAFTRLVRSHADLVAQQGQFTADFCNMYTSFSFSDMVSRTMHAVQEAWDFQKQLYSTRSDCAMDTHWELSLGVGGWSRSGEGLTVSQISEMLHFLIHTNFTFNGGKVRRQIRGMPMGMPAAPQIANLSCYPVEKIHSYNLGPEKTMTVTRYIDDFWSSGVPLPPQDAYGMNYVVTAEGSSVVYLGVKVYFEERAGRLSVHTTVYDREFSYPLHPSSNLGVSSWAA